MMENQQKTKELMIEATSELTEAITDECKKMPKMRRNNKANKKR